jgi:hypothetical protein
MSRYASFRVCERASDCGDSGEPTFRSNTIASTRTNTYREFSSKQFSDAERKERSNFAERKYHRTSHNCNERWFDPRNAIFFRMAPILQSLSLLTLLHSVISFVTHLQILHSMTSLHGLFFMFSFTNHIQSIRQSVSIPPTCRRAM